MSRLNQVSGDQWHAQVLAAKNRRVKVLKLIETAPRTITQIRRHTRSSVSVARSDVATLIAHNFIHSVDDPTRQKSSKIYHFGPGDSEKATKGFQARHATVKSWKPTIPAHHPLMAIAHAWVVHS